MPGLLFMRERRERRLGREKAGRRETERESSIHIKNARERLGELRHAAAPALSVCRHREGAMPAEVLQA